MIASKLLQKIKRLANHFGWILLVLLTALGCQPESTSAPSQTKVNSDQAVTSVDELRSDTTEMLKRHSLAENLWTGKDNISTETPDEALIYQFESTSTKIEEEPVTSNLGIVTDASNLESEFTGTQETDSDYTRADTEGSKDYGSLSFPPLNDPNKTDETIMLNFEQVEIRHFLKVISDTTGVNFVIHPNINGKITVVSPTGIRLGNIFEYLQSILTVNGIALIPAEDHIKIVPRSEANKHNLPIRVGTNPAQIPLNDSVYTQIMNLKYAGAVQVSTLLRSRLSSEAQMDAYPPTNTILLTDTSSNIHLIAQIIKQLDVPGAKKMQTVISLKHADAQEVSKKISTLIEQQSVFNKAPTLQGMQLPSKPQIIADIRTNRLIVIANHQDTQNIMQLVKKLDIIRPAGRDNIHVVSLENAQAKDIAQALETTVASLNAENESGREVNLQITPHENTNSLIITATPQNFEVVSKIIKQLDIYNEQVLVEMLFVEISDENLREIGVDWATLDQAVSDSVRIFGNTNFGIRVDALNGDLQGLSVGTFKEVGGEVKIGTILSALENVSGLNILSTPKITTYNHQEAHIVVGDNIPRVTADRITEVEPSAPTVIRTIEYTDVGINLKITPHVNHGRNVYLEIDSEFSQLVESVTGLSAETPTTATRKLKTNVSLKDGTTLVLGGLIRDNKTTVEKKIPLLGDLPLIGGIFKLKRDRIQKTNLLMFITPHILSNSEQIAQINKSSRAQITPELNKRIRKESESKDDLLESIWR